MKQPTLREYMAFSSHKPILVCPLDEEKEHLRQYKQVWACPVMGIGPTRQWILENATADVICVVSDDMRFCVRPDPSNIRLERCVKLDPMMDLIVECVRDGFIHGGLGPRQGNNHKDCKSDRKGFLKEGKHGVHLFTDCERVNDFHFMDRKAVLKTGARLDAIPLMEDFYFTLTLLCQGRPNRVIHDYVWNQEASGKTGGCSLYRTLDLQTQSALALKKAFPRYVNLMTKRSKDSSTAWNDMKARTDVRVAWHTAYLEAVERINEEARIREFRKGRKRV